jgi:coatomer subunit beta
MYKDNKNKQKEKPCWLYIDSEPITSFKEIHNKITSKDLDEKKEALRTVIAAITNDDNYPDNLMILALHNLMIVDDIEIRKLLFLFWEVIEKKYADGRVREELFLVCNNLRKDLTSPNEYVRGRTLRLVAKLPYNEMLENLKSAIFDNLTHKHHYVRKNALVCLMSIIVNFGIDVLPSDINEKLKDIIEKDLDISTRRNAYLALAKIDPKESFIITKDILHNTDLNELSDLFTLAIVENLRSLCKLVPKEKPKLLKMLCDLSAHKSHSVIFEIGNSLLSLSSNPNIVRNAVNNLCSLLNEQKDNNTLIIILRKLIEIKNKYKNILEEQILSFATILDSNCTNELRKLLFELISDLIKESNISSVFDIFINDFNKLKNVNDTDTTIEFKNMILLCIYKNIIKYPKLNKSYPLYLLEKCLLYNSRNTFVNEQIMIIKDIMNTYGNYCKDYIQIILKNFGDINNPEILQSSIWLLPEYSKDLDSQIAVFDIIMKNIGDLNLELVENKKIITDKPQEKKIITKTVILSDGTYGTQTVEIDANEYSRQKENMKYLRSFILETNYFFSTNLVEALTRILINICETDTEKQYFHKYYINTIEIIIAITEIKSDKIYKDPDNVSRINICMNSLIDNNILALNEWIKESRQNYLSTYKIEEDKEVKNTPCTNVNVDDCINFRHVKPFDADDVEEDNTNKDYNTKTNNKFIEVLTGTEDPLLVEVSVEIFTFDIVIEFHIKNTLKSDLQNICLELYAPENLSIIEKPPQINLAPQEIKTVRSCFKFSSTSNSYIFGQVSYADNKGYNKSLNLSGINVDLLNTYQADISESNFRKYWVEYNWEHNVIIISKKKYILLILGTSRMLYLL